MKTVSLPLKGSFAFPQTNTRAWAFVLMALLLLLVMLAGVAFGGSTISLQQVLLGLLEPLGAETEGALTQSQLYIVQSVRLPRVLVGAVVGAGLGVAGAAMQALFRNPLAEPGLIGVSAGAMLGAGFYIVLFSGMIPLFLLPIAPWLLPLAALVGALVFTFWVYKLGSNRGVTRTEILLLAGIALNALAGAAMGFLIFIADDQQIRSLTFWSLGSLAATNWQVWWIILAGCGLPALVMLRYARVLNLLLLGEAEATHLGINVQRLKKRLLALAALMVAVGVAFTGMIGFVGLVVPHLLRLFRGPDHHWVLPGSALLGAVLLVGADLAARTLAPPQELPIGVLTASLGVPFFLWLLMRFQRMNRF